MNADLFRQAVRGLALFCAMAPLAGVAHAGSLNVNPIRVTLSAKQPVAALTLRNAGAEPTVVQIETSAWSQSMGKDVLTPSSDVLATPPIFTIAPGATQILRVGLRKQPQASGELTYRLILREVPPKKPTPGLRVALTISMPVFVLPPSGVAPDVKWKATRTADGKIRMQATNGGNAHVQVGKIDLKAEGKDVGSRGVSEYVLPGNSREWVVDASAKHSVGTLLRVVAKTDAGMMEADVPLEAEVATAAAGTAATPTAASTTPPAATPASLAAR
jgi:fimbrial chaperone protein